jgi:hypothetical protein
MTEALATLLLIVFFVAFGFREISSQTPFGLFIGSVSVLIAVAFILGSVQRF